jgi:precorrin-6B methylase 2
MSIILKIKNRRPKRAVPSTRLELGSGTIPRNALWRAISSARAKKNSQIIAVDAEEFDNRAIQKLAFKMGFWGKPTNLVLQKGDAFSILKKIKSKSLNVIFSAYMLHINPGREAELLQLARRTLKEKGRVVLVLDKLQIVLWRKIAEQENFSFQFREIPDKVSSVSDHESLQLRSNQKLRDSIRLYLRRNNFVTDEQIDKLVAEKIIKSRNDSDIVKPVIIVMKPKK